MGYKFRLAIAFVVLIFIGVMLIGQYSKDSRAMAKGMRDFNTLTAAEFMPGEFVQGTVYDIQDEFAYMEEYSTTFGIKTGKERITEHYYVVPLYASYDMDMDYPQYVAVCLTRGDMIAVAEQMMQENWDYWQTGEEPDYWTELPLTGKVSPMSGEILDYFYDWVMYGEESTDRADFDKYVAPFVIRYYEPESTSGALIGGIIMLVIGIAGAAVMITMAAKNKQSGNSSASYGSSVGYDAYPTSTGYDPAGSTTGYTPAASDAGNVPTDTSSASSYGDTAMDELDTSSLGVGIDDDQN